MDDKGLKIPEKTKNGQLEQNSGIQNKKDRDPVKNKIKGINLLLALKQKT